MALESRIFTYEAELEWRGGRASVTARDPTPKAERDCFVSASTTAEVSTDWRIIE